MFKASSEPASVMEFGREPASSSLLTVPEMTYNVFSGTLNPTHFTSPASSC